MINEEKIIIAPADKEIRDILVSENINFIFVMPSLDSKDTLIKRYIERGNNPKYIQRAINDLEKWSNLDNDYETVVLAKENFLEDWLLKEKYINI